MLPPAGMALAWGMLVAGVVEDAAMWCAQELFLRSSRPWHALDMLESLERWEDAIALAPKLDPPAAAAICARYAKVCIKLPYSLPLPPMSFSMVLLVRCGTPGRGIQANFTSHDFV